MKAVVVYESHWGNTEAIAKAVAEGYGPEAVVLTTDEARPDVVAEAELIVAGAPVLAFSLASEKMISGLATDDGGPTPPETSRRPMRAWLQELASGRGVHAAFETRVWWSPGGATGAIERFLEASGYARLAKPQRFVVEGKYGPLRKGELERAREWGAELAAMMTPAMAPTA
jgi:hypothetical protein